MKIVAVMGSPHKGNTLEITRRVEKEMKQAGSVEFEYIHLKDVDLKPCKGCYVCFYRGEHLCPLKDDVEKIAGKMEEADGVIFVSPVYSMQVSYLFKLFVDRFAYMFHRPRYFGKYAMGIAAAGNPGLGVSATLKYIKLVAGQMGFEYVDQLGLAAPPKNTDLPRLGTKKERTAEAARKFYQAVKEKRPRKLTFGDYLWFRSVQAVFNTIGSRNPTDYEYYKERGWLDRQAKFFYSHVRGNAFKDFLARMIGSMTGRQVRKFLET